MAHDVPILPAAVVGPADINRLMREVDNINEHLLQVKLRQVDSPERLPETTRIMDEISAVNKLNLLKDGDRKRLLDFLKAVKAQAPVIHMSFASEPTPDFLDKLITWIRQEINAYVLLTIGLQPTIGAGCILRTANRYWDLSLQQTLFQQRRLLMKKLVPEVNAEQ
ncbi:MAG: hypothetical protein ACREHG_01360 [Candidatus Saccharimonadales bacterium]